MLEAQRTTAALRERIATSHEEAVASSVDMLTLVAANRRDTKRYRSLTTERRQTLEAFAHRLDRMAARA